ncbi:MAG TPA: serine/threonine-protein kinase [Gemmatales bacterium]|nr:serine/threonine-protein kinase [Gemmatales bacterium]
MARAFQQGDEPVNGYRLVKYLGKGSFGDVWQATGPGGTEVAFKIIKLDDKPNIKNLRLIELVKKIRHPNLCPILALWIRGEEGVVTTGEERGLASARTQTFGEFSLDDEQPKVEALYLAMGLGEKSLLERFKDCKELGEVGIPAMELISYFDDAARAIDFLNASKHELGKGPTPLPHCDIKPQNLLIVGGAAQVCDFGLMAVLRGCHPNAVSSMSAAFHSPEILDGGEATSYSDQYSLAISYHFLRTGALPFSMNEANVVLTEALEGRLDLSRLSTAEQQVIRRATSRRPEARYENCQDLARELRRAIERSGTVHVDGLVIEPNREIVPGHKLISLIGRGAYGEVWQALAPGRLPIALKIIKDLDRASGRGRQEFRALEIIQHLNHHALMELRAYWLLDRHGQAIPDELRGQVNSPVPATLVIATKLADMNLTQVMERYQQEESKPGIPVQELLGYLRQVAGALDYLNQPKHRMGNRLVSIQHRDVKPDNIMLANEMIKLTDFGLAKVLETDNVVAEIRQDSVGFTFHYAAPEVLRGKVTKWSDQYSLAITYYQLRTGELPYGKDCSAYDQMMRQLEGQLDLSRLLPAERKIVARATSVIPEERFPSCKALLEALTKAVPPAGELSKHDLDDAPSAKPAPTLVKQSAYGARMQDPPSDLVPIIPSVPAGQRLKTMPVLLAKGEVYPAPIKTPIPASSGETDHEAPAATKIMAARAKPQTKEEHARKPDSQYFLPLVIVFTIGISMAGLVHFLLRGPATEGVAKSTSPEDSPLDDRPYEFVGPIYEDRKPGEGIINVEASKPSVGNTSQPRLEQALPVPNFSKPPDLLTPTTVTTPVPPPIMVLGRNISDPTFPSFLNTSLDRIIANTNLPVQFSRSLRELEQVPISMNSAKLLAFRAECMLEGESKNVSTAGTYLSHAAELGEASAYLQYVQARYWQEQRDPARAVAALEESLKRDISLAGFRRDRALAIFEEGAQRVQIITDARTLSATVATPVPSWIAVAERYLGKVQSGSSLTMLLATMNPAPKDPALLQPVLTASVQDEWSKRPQGAVLITSLRLKQIDAALTAKQTTQALGMYADTWDYIKKNRAAFDTTSPLVFNDRILAPAQRLAAGIKPNAVRNTQLATILAAQGDLIYQSPNEAWPIPTSKRALQVAAEDYGEAAKLETGHTRAEYLSGQGRCMIRWAFDENNDSAKLDQGRDDLIQATSIDSNLADAHYWLGRYYLVRSDLAKANESFMKAIMSPDQGKKYLALALQVLDAAVAQAPAAQKGPLQQLRVDLQSKQK